MAIKIPTNKELKAKREQQEADKRRTDRQRVEHVLYNKVLVYRYHVAVALEAHDVIVPTTDYNKAFKRDGNRVLKHLERITDDKFYQLYKEHPEYTSDMTDKVSKVVEMLSEVDIMDYDNLMDTLIDFHKKIRLSKKY